MLSSRSGWFISLKFSVFFPKCFYNNKMFCGATILAYEVRLSWVAFLPSPIVIIKSERLIPEWLVKLHFLDYGIGNWFQWFKKREGEEKGVETQTETKVHKSEIEVGMIYFLFNMFKQQSKFYCHNLFLCIIWFSYL